MWRAALKFFDLMPNICSALSNCQKLHSKFWFTPTTKLWHWSIAASEGSATVRTRQCTVSRRVVLYGCETSSLTLREECRLRLFQNRVLRKIFEPKRDEVTREWRKLHNVELNDLYCPTNIIQVIKWRRIRWMGHASGTGERRGVYRVLVAKTWREQTTWKT
jgi:hypothetical protein